MKRITSYCILDGETSLMKIIILALETFAKTTLREVYKADVPFTEEHFKRELIIFRIIKDLLAGPRVGGNMDAQI